MNISAAEAHLKSADPVLGRAMETLQLAPRGHEPDAWRALVSSICGQQISVHAARAVRNRVAALEPGREFPSPRFVLAAGDETLRGAGLSRAKVLAVRDLAARVCGVVRAFRAPTERGCLVIGFVGDGVGPG